MPNQSLVVSYVPAEPFLFFKFKQRRTLRQYVYCGIIRPLKFFSLPIKFLRNLK